jgi:hypothetical protein
MAIVMASIDRDSGLQDALSPGQEERIIGLKTKIDMK